MAAPKKEMKAIEREAARQGWRVEQRKGRTSTATLFYAPDGENIVTVHATPSDHRALANVLAQLRKFGFVWKGR